MLRVRVLQPPRCIKKYFYYETSLLGSWFSLVLIFIFSTNQKKKNKIKTIIIPKANQKDLEEIPENVKSGINFIPVSDVKEVLQIALGID